jgi:hypothetical protein
MENLSSFERSVLDAFLVGSESTLETLRIQAAVATVSSREHTGSGAYINFHIPDSVARISPGRIILEDVNVHVGDVEHGVATLLWVTAGLLDFIEFATFTGTWPKDPRLLALGYYRAQPSERGTFTMIPLAPWPAPARHTPMPHKWSPESGRR